MAGPCRRPAGPRNCSCPPDGGQLPRHCPHKPQDHCSSPSLGRESRGVRAESGGHGLFIPNTSARPREVAATGDVCQPSCTLTQGTAHRGSVLPSVLLESGSASPLTNQRCPGCERPSRKWPELAEHKLPPPFGMKKLIAAMQPSEHWPAGGRTSAQSPL